MKKSKKNQPLLSTAEGLADEKPLGVFPLGYLYYSRLQNDCKGDLL